MQMHIKNKMIETIHTYVCLLLLINSALSLQIVKHGPNYFNNNLKRCPSNNKLFLQLINTEEIPVEVGKANLDWPNLGFQYRPTNSFVYLTYENGEWSDIKVSKEEYIPIHIGATALHYGQACFEGLKAFHCNDNKVRIFRPQENARRMQQSCERICMPSLTEEQFITAVRHVVKDNLEFLPPYGTGGALYLRPILYGSGPKIGLQPADSYTFILMAIPVADYYKGGMKPVHAIVVEDFDRAAPRGVGNVKVAGNYAADIQANIAAKKQGYPICLYLDAKTNSYIEEFSTSNFFGIHKSGAFVTPSSSAILKSITNKSLMEIARSEGIEVQVRQISIDEVMNGDFTEVAACGTAVVITPISSLTYGGKTTNFGNDTEHVGPVLKTLYDRVRAIQTGVEKDSFGWLVDL